MKSIGTALAEAKNVNRPTNLHTEFQHYGVIVAEALEDTNHYSLYIKLCKNFPRNIIDQALNYAKDYHKAKNKAKIFMWRLKQLKEAMNISQDQQLKENSLTGTSDEPL